MAKVIIHEKQCPTCKLTKPASEFYSHRSRKDGLTVYCKTCYATNYRSKHPVEIEDSLHGEEWRPVVGYEKHYSVSNKGRVRRDCPGPSTYKGRIVRPYNPPNRRDSGYERVRVSDGHEMKMCFVHRLVADAFISPREGNMYVNHKDGNTRDNRPENLEWVTNAENIRHAARTFLSFAIKLCPNQVKEIRKQARQGVTHKDIAVQFGLNQSTVSRIVNRLVWAHVV